MGGDSTWTEAAAEPESHSDSESSESVIVTVTLNKRPEGLKASPAREGPGRQASADGVTGPAEAAAGRRRGAAASRVTVARLHGAAGAP